MPDFTSALYLGMRHPSGALPPWDMLTLGQPAALREPPVSAAVAEQLARLQGCEAALMLPSTLHLFRDLFGVLRRLGGRIVILVDAGSYPIARWGTERAAVLGVPVARFGHHDPAALARQVAHWHRHGHRPVIVADGFCPACGRAAPVAAYAALARGHGGWLVLDDTQALGVLGTRDAMHAEADAAANGAPDAKAPLGRGGGGSLRWHGVQGPHLVVGASLAKAFGAPVAVLSGSAALVAQFRAHSDTQLHCSPPSVAVLQAARHALAVNAVRGDALRARLARLVARLRERLVRAGLVARGTALPFPVQSFTAASGVALQALYRGLLAQGIRVLLTRVCRMARPRLTVLLTARHSEHDIDLAARAIAALTHAGRDAPAFGGGSTWTSP